MKTIIVSFEDAEMEAIEKMKGNEPWRDFIIGRVYANAIKTAKIRRYIKDGVWYAKENSTEIVRNGKTEKEALTALENALLAYPSYVLTEAQTKAIPDALVAIREAKKETW